MDRMRRILFTVISGLSLLLLLAVAVVWARSFWIRDIVTYVTDSGEGRMIQSIRGRLHVIMDLSGTSNGGFSHHQDRLAPNAFGWNITLLGDLAPSLARRRHGRD